MVDRRPFVRGDIWFADLDPVRGNEQARRQPVVIVHDQVRVLAAERLVGVNPGDSVSPDSLRGIDRLIHLLFELP